MLPVLLIEENEAFGAMVKDRIRIELQRPAHWARSYRESMEILENKTIETFAVAITDIGLSDARNGEIVDLLAQRRIPIIVYASDIDLTERQAAWQKRVVDCVTRDNPHSLDYILSLIRRLERNQSTGVLIVDDEVDSRRALRSLLEIHQYRVHEAADAATALAILEQIPSIKLVLADFIMPDIDGCQLTQMIRRRHPKEDMAIIGLSDQGAERLSSHFLRSGANDFIHMPCSPEEFYCRVSQNMEIMELFARLKDSSERDWLTGLYNRRFFFEIAQKAFERAKRRETDLIIAMIDIDHFKWVNDTHGHAAGDAALVQVAYLLANSLRSADVVCRFGGEEFCVLAVDMNAEDSPRVFDKLRRAVETASLAIGDKELRVTVSIGISAKRLGSLDDCIRQADEALYEAKAGGRNRVVMHA
ncbi:MAG: Response regulator PleD [candidate division BRC1 bacterium ADurb.BinA364]|nr:MAG: Response regulator PleD [candidate division BRC1 bacterium ADurb.BinA364]